MAESESKVPTLFRDLAPRRREVLVGDEVLVVAEPTMETWEGFMALVSEAIDGVQEFKKLAGVIAPGGKRAPAEQIVGALLERVDDLAALAQRFIRDVLGKNVPDLARVVLATRENGRRLVAAGLMGEGLNVLDATKLKAAVAAYAAESLTVRQAIVVLEAFVEVTDVSDVLGKSRRLGEAVRTALRQQNGAAAGAPPV